MNEDVTSELMARRQLEVRGALGDLQGALVTLADDLSTARSPSWDSSGDFEGSGREVLQVSAGLAQALVDWLDPMDLTYGDLDQVLRAIASREPKLETVASHGAKVFEFLRRISYGGLPSAHDAPDMEDFNGLLEQAVEILERGAP